MMTVVLKLLYHRITIADVMVCPLRANVGCSHDKLDYCSVLAHGHYNLVHTYDDKDTKFYEKYEASKAFYT